MGSFSDWTASVFVRFLWESMRGVELRMGGEERTIIAYLHDHILALKPVGFQLGSHKSRHASSSGKTQLANL